MGIKGFKTLSILTSAIPHVVIRTDATGGVICPIAILMQVIIPN